MPPRENSKATAAKAKKAESKAEADSKKAQQKEAEVEKDWQQGAKSNSKAEAEQQKREEQLRKKLEKEALLKAEEEAIAAKPPRPARGEAKVALKKQGNLDAVLAGVGSDDAEAYAATGIDSALDLMAALEVSPSGAGAGKTGIDRHPERRMKSAYASFEESELPRLKKENPTLRQSQIKQLLAKSWKKSPLNPMNQATVAHNATAEEERDFAQALRDGVLESMKVND